MARAWGNLVLGGCGAGFVTISAANAGKSKNSGNKHRSFSFCRLFSSTMFRLSARLYNQSYRSGLLLWELLYDDSRLTTVFGLPAEQGRWLLIPLGMTVLLCLGTVYSWSVFPKPVGG